MAPRKRGREEMESADSDHQPSTLDGLRNMWEFANLMQYIYIFGDAAKIDKDLDIEVSLLSTPVLLPLEQTS